MPDKDETKSAPCPQCSGEMMLARIFPKFGAYPELRSYQCVDCGHMVTIEEEE